MTDDKTVVEFPKLTPEVVPPEERARRALVVAQDLARANRPAGEWELYVEASAKNLGIPRAELEVSVKAIIRQREKDEQAAKAEQRHLEQRVEKQRIGREKAKAREEDRQERRARRDARDEIAAERREARRQRDIDRQFAIIARQPTAEQDSRLTEAAARLGEDVDVLRAQFVEFLDIERERRGVGDVEPWPEPVNVNTLLNDIHRHRGSYVIIHDEDGAVATTLWTAFSWVHDIATHSPPLLVTSADAGGNAAKTLLCGVLKYLTPRGKTVAELSGASFFHMIDRTHPTLIIDNAENLFTRRKALLELLNQSWTRGTPVLRQVHGNTVEYDVFCPKVIGAIAGSNFLPPNTMQRTIRFGMLPKLPSETVDREFAYADDDEFLTLRRKLARFARDNAETLRTAKPAVPEGFDNRLWHNWKLICAIADLAGGSWPKWARAAAIKLTQEYSEPSEGQQCLKLFCDLFVRSEFDGLVTSKWVQREFVGDPTSDWAHYRGRGPITQWGIKHILRPYGIRPDVIHPRGRPADRGYRLTDFTIPFRHYLGIEVADILAQRRTRKK